MKTNTRFILGLVSSLLFTCGFVQAAERIDPISAASTPTPAGKVLSATPGCTTLTNIASDLHSEEQK